MSQKEEQNNDANNELMNKLSNIFGNNNDKKENNAEKSDELKNYIDGDEGEEIKPANKRNNDDSEQESRDVGNGNSIGKTTICRVIGWFSIAIGIASIVLGALISSFFFIATAVSVVSLCINIGIVNYENQKEYLQQYIAKNEPTNAKENEYGEQQYRKNEVRQDDIGNEQTKIENNKKVKDDATKLDGAENFLNKKNKKIDDNEPNYTKQDENRAQRKDNGVDANRF